MQLKDFPSCCTATVMIGMGTCSTQDYQAKVHNTEGSDWAVASEVVRHMQAETYRRHAVITCITTNEQEQANRVLRKLGWVGSKWMSKGSHSETKIRLWHFPIMNGMPTQASLNELFGL